jgi:L-asparaginase
MKIQKRMLRPSAVVRRSPIVASLWIGLVLLNCRPGLAQTPSAAQQLPRVLVIATGGTIAGEQREPGTFGGYEIKKTVNEVLNLVPEAKHYAQLEAEQFLNIPSPNITPENWLQLARRINDVFRERPDISGIVVTHGTSRLEETAFFLHLTVRSDRPVVIVGAQRPPTGISPDGPLNLLSGIRVAATPEARGKGALVVMDERIISARDVQKYFARSGGFEANEMGTLGIVAPHGVEFFYTPLRRHTLKSEFDVSAIEKLPRVDIHYSFAGAEGPGPTDAKGVVVASTGFTPAERAYYDALQRKGVIVAATFPSGSQVASPAGPRDAVSVIAVERLLPVHARILLMLALTRTSDLREIQRIFNEY